MNEFRKRLYEQYRSSMGDADDDQAWRIPQIRRLVKAHFPLKKDAAILDLGCGAGIFLRILHESGYSNLAGVDASAEQVAIAHRNGLGMVRQGDLFSHLEQTESATLDAVLAYDIIEHLGSDELLRMADEVFRVLRPDGRWILHVPNAEGVFGSRVRWADLTHERAFTPHSLGQLARVAGFTGAACHDDPPVACGPTGITRRLLYAIMRIPFWLFWLAETGTLRTRWIAGQNMIAIFEKGRD